MIVFADAALTDLERIFAFHLEFDAQWAMSQVESIRTAVMILDQHPFVGRKVSGELRELVISGKPGYIALYQYEEFDHLVRILAVRHQREAGYRGR